MASVEYLGIDVGGTNVKMGIVDANTGKISNFYSHDTISWRQSGHFIERFGDAVALQLLANKDVKQVGIGLPVCLIGSVLFHSKLRPFLKLMVYRW